MDLRGNFIFPVVGIHRMSSRQRGWQAIDGDKGDGDGDGDNVVDGDGDEAGGR